MEHGFQNKFICWKKWKEQCEKLLVVQKATNQRKLTCWWDRRAVWSTVQQWRDEGPTSIIEITTWRNQIMNKARNKRFQEDIVKFPHKLAKLHKKISWDVIMSCYKAFFFFEERQLVPAALNRVVLVISQGRRVLYNNFVAALGICLDIENTQDLRHGNYHGCCRCNISGQ